MNIVRLVIRITHQKRTVTNDSWNHSVVTYVDQSTIWASVYFKGGRETQSAEQRVYVDRMYFTIRPNTDDEVTDRIYYAGAFYDIQSIETFGRGCGHRLITTRRDNDE